MNSDMYHDPEQAEGEFNGTYDHDAPIEEADFAPADIEMGNTLAQIIGAYWLQVKDGDPRVSAIYKRHYSCNQYADGRRNQPQYPNRHLVMGPGEKMVLLSADCRAIFGWRKFIDQSGQEGINCAFFRNEGAFGGRVLSSVLILYAEKLAWNRWKGERLYTYVNAEAIRSSNPGYTFQMAGWRKCGMTKSGLIILEKCAAGNLDLCTKQR